MYILPYEQEMFRHILNVSPEKYIECTKCKHQRSTLLVMKVESFFLPQFME